MKTIILNSDQQKRYIISLIEGTKLDGSYIVEYKKNQKDSTSKQRRLQWLWNSEIALAGIGSDDNKEDVHIRSKWMFARPILLRDCEIFGAVFNGFKFVIKDYDQELKKKCMKEFTRDYISTEQMNIKQRAEYLTEIQKYWTMKGVNLTDPAIQGVNLNF